MHGACLVQCGCGHGQKPPSRQAEGSSIPLGKPGSAASRHAIHLLPGTRARGSGQTRARISAARRGRSAIQASRKALVSSARSRIFSAACVAYSFLEARA